MPKPAPHATGGSVGGLAPIGERRGAIVAGALVCSTLLVVGYGSGIGVVPMGALTASAPTDAPTGQDGGDTTATTTLPDLGLDVPEAGFVGTDAPGGGGVGITTPGAGGLPGITTLPGISLPSVTLPSTPPGISVPPPVEVPPPAAVPPPSTTPPGATPPAECATLVSDLLGGLVGYLAGPAPDPVLVQHVSDALGLEALLGGSSGGLLDLGGVLGLGGVLDLPSTLGLDQVLGAVTGAVLPTITTTVGTMTGSAVELTPNLIPALRGILGVDLLATATTTADELLGLLGALLGGC